MRKKRQKQYNTQDVGDAHRWRLHQAHELIKSVVVVIGGRKIAAYVERPEGGFVRNPEVERLRRSQTKKRKRRSQ